MSATPAENRYFGFEQTLHFSLDFPSPQAQNAPHIALGVHSSSNLAALF
jgi:hypothetical protein